MQCTKCGQELPERAGFCPCCGEKAAGGNQEKDKPIYLADVKGWLKSGQLAVYCDRVEFSTSSVQKIVFHYDSLVSVKKAASSDSGDPFYYGRRPDRVLRRYLKKYSRSVPVCGTGG